MGFISRLGSHSVDYVISQEALAPEYGDMRSARIRLTSSPISPGVACLLGWHRWTTHCMEDSGPGISASSLLLGPGERPLHSYISELLPLRQDIVFSISHLRSLSGRWIAVTYSGSEDSLSTMFFPVPSGYPRSNVN